MTAPKPQPTRQGAFGISKSWEATGGIAPLLLAEFIRATKVIDQMAPYIGKMAVPADFFADLNEHFLYVEKLQRAGLMAKPKGPKP